MKQGIVVSIFIAMLFLAVQPSGIAVANDGCVIPESGPWPPCATGGNSGSTDPGDCVIPESGPWPPCATGGNSGDASGCVIPESGPWPPCATSGGAPVPPDHGEGCIIPDSGPWPPCATGGGGGETGSGTVGSETLNPTTTAWVIHQGRGAKQVDIPVTANGQVAKIEMTVDFTFSDGACSVSPNGSVDLATLGYALIAPSGRQVDLIEVGGLSGMQEDVRAEMRFADGGSRVSRLADGRYQSADSLAQLNGENVNGTWKIVMTKQSFDDAICQHSATLHITTR